jgi:lipoprotein LprG
MSSRRSGPRPERLGSCVAALVCLVLLGACSGGKRPAASPLLHKAAEAMGEVSSVRFRIDVDGVLSPLPIVHVDGVLTRAGDAKGSFTSEVGNDLIESDFVLLGGELFYRGSTGPYQILPARMAGAVYDPAVLLAESAGLPSVLAGAQGAETKGTERVAGVETYEIRARVTPELLEGLTVLDPGQERIPAKLWVATEGGLLIRAEVEFRTLGERSDTKLVLTLSNFDKPVTIERPPTR